VGVSIPLEFGTKKSEPHRHRIELETPPWGTRLPPGQRRAHPPRAAAPASLTAPRGPPPTLRCRLPQGEADEMGADRPADRPAELSLIEKCAVDALLGAHARFSDLFPVEAEVPRRLPGRSKHVVEGHRGHSRDCERPAVERRGGREDSPDVCDGGGWSSCSTGPRRRCVPRVPRHKRGWRRGRGELVIPAGRVHT